MKAPVVLSTAYACLPLTWGGHIEAATLTDVTSVVRENPMNPTIINLMVPSAPKFPSASLSNDTQCIHHLCPRGLPLCLVWSRVVATAHFTCRLTPGPSLDMKISSIVLLLVASAASCDAAVNCSDEPRACPALCGPVCGSDGKSYSNSCELDWAACDDKNLTKTSDGVCPNDANWDSQRCESKPSGGSSSAPGPVGSGGNDVEMPPSSTVSPGSGGSRSDGSSSPPSAVGSSSNDKKAVPQPSSDASVSVAAWGIMVGVLASASLVM